MTRLIDADALLEEIKTEEKEGVKYWPVVNLLDLITNAPTVQREGWVSDKERIDYLSNGGWEVLQDPKYWTDGLNVRQVIDRNITELQAAPTDKE